MNNSDNKNNEYNLQERRYVHSSQVKQNASNHVSQSIHPGIPNVHPDNLGQIGGGQVGHPEHMDHFSHSDQMGFGNTYGNYDNVAYNLNQTRVKPTKNHIINPWIFKISIFVLSSIGILAMFIPFISVNIFGFSNSINLFMPGDSFGDGVIYVVLLAILIVLTIFNQKIIGFITSVITAIGFSYTLFSLSSGAGEYSLLLTPDVGYYLGCLSIYGLVVVTLIYTILSYIEKKVTGENIRKASFVDSNPSGQVHTPQDNVKQNSYTYGRQEQYGNHNQDIGNEKSIEPEENEIDGRKENDSNIDSSVNWNG